MPVYEACCNIPFHFYALLGCSRNTRSCWCRFGRFMFRGRFATNQRKDGSNRLRGWEYRCWSIGLLGCNTRGLQGKVFLFLDKWNVKIALNNLFRLAGSNLQCTIFEICLCVCMWRIRYKLFRNVTQAVFISFAVGFEQEQSKCIAGNVCGSSECNVGWCWWLRKCEKRASRTCTISSRTSRQVPEIRYDSLQRSFVLRTTWMWKNFAGEGHSQRMPGKLHIHKRPRALNYVVWRVRGERQGYIW